MTLVVGGRQMKKIYELRDEAVITLFEAIKHEYNHDIVSDNFLDKYIENKIAHTELITDGKIVNEIKKTDEGLRSIFIDGDLIEPVDTVNTRIVWLKDYSYAIRVRKSNENITGIQAYVNDINDRKTIENVMNIVDSMFEDSLTNKEVPFQKVR